MRLADRTFRGAERSSNSAGSYSRHDRARAPRLGRLSSRPSARRGWRHVRQPAWHRWNSRWPPWCFDSQGHSDVIFRHLGLGAGPTDLQVPISSPQPAPVSPSTTPFYGTLEIPTGDDDGPPNGLTLDRAIDIMLERNLDLRSQVHGDPDGAGRHLTGELAIEPCLLSGWSAFAVWRHEHEV